MKKKRLRETAIAIAILLLVLGISVLLSLKNGKDRYDIVIFGDSLIAGTGTEKTISELVSESTGMSAINAGFGGMTLSESGTYGTEGNYDFFYTLVQLSVFVKNHDFSVFSHAKMKYDYILGEDWRLRAEALSRVDWKSIKYVIVSYGVNDYFVGNLPDNPDNKYDVTTYGGALRTSIENISSGIPGVTIILQTPAYCYLYGYGKDCTEIAFDDYYLSEYAEVELEVAAEYGLPVIDNYNDNIFNKNNIAECTYDGLHPSDYGNQILAGRIADKIEEINELTSDDN